MDSLCVFCGSCLGQESGYADAARTLGRLLAKRGISLVFGGGSIGLMGAIADATLDAGGRAIGVIPRLLWEQEVGHRGLSSLFIVDTMHERKAKMAELADAFVVLPGGIGTLEEFFEVWTWGFLGIHAKPVGILNVGGYYDALIAALEGMAENGFIRPSQTKLLRVASQAETLLDRLEADIARAAPSKRMTGT